MNNNTNINQVTEGTTQTNNAQTVTIVTPNQPIEQQNINHTIVEPLVNEQQITENIVTQQMQENVNQNIQTELQNIPTVEQDKDAFINNVQSMNHEKKEEKKEGVNFVFIIILFVVVLVAIYFLFPILLNYI